MKKTGILSLLMMMITVSALSAQTSCLVADNNEGKTSKGSTVSMPAFSFQLYPIGDELEKINEEIAGDHVLGTLIAKKMVILDNRYTYQAQLVPGNPETRTIIKKPIIYDAVKCIDRYLRKAVKKGEISIQKAEQDYHKVLDTALNILSADTGLLEKELEKSTNAAAQLSIFTKQVTLFM